MLDESKIKVSNASVNFRSIGIANVYKLKDYLFIKFDNMQKILTNGQDLYDVSDYDYVDDIFNMGNRLCGVFIKFSKTFVIDIKTKEILFEDENAYNVSKKDDRTLHVIKNIGNNAIYDIKTKKYLPTPKNYEFENSLGNNLYVFKENDKNKEFYDKKRCVINVDGKVLLEDIDGWIEAIDNYIIIKRSHSICIVNINEDSILDIRTIKKDSEMIADPDYRDGNIIVIKKGTIEIYNLDLEPTNKFIIDDLTDVIDYEIISNILKICIPYTSSDKQINKHLFLNLETGAIITHIRIEPYPYWTPTTYIGQDSIESGLKDFHFYDSNFKHIISIRANSYEDIDSNMNNTMFLIKGVNGDIEKDLLINAENGNIKENNYDYIHFHLTLPYGYGVNCDNERMDFFDRDFNVIISDFDYNKFNLNFIYTEFSYFIVNDYVCIKSRVLDGYGQYRLRTIIYKASGEIILDSFSCKCYALGDFIQIIDNKKSEFLNTITGEIGPLVIEAPVNKSGKIDFNNINNIGNILDVSDDKVLKKKKLVTNRSNT